MSIDTLDEFSNHNICIGHYAGIDITNEGYKLIVKSTTIDMNETMTEREYELVSKTVKGIFENYYQWYKAL
jgi:hypothetical protein